MSRQRRVVNVSRGAPNLAAVKPHAQNPTLATQSFGNTAGVLWGYRVRNGAAEPVSESNLADCLADTESWLWLQFALSDHRARRFLEGFSAAPQEARAFLLGPEKRVQLHLSPGWGWGILPDLEKDFEGRSLGMGQLFFMADGRHLITARHHPLRVADEIRPAMRGATALKGPADVLVAHVERFNEIVEARLAELSQMLDGFEDLVLSDRSDIDNLPLGPLRSEASRYRREFAGLRNALHRALSHRPHQEDQFLADRLPRLLQQAEDFDRDTAALQDRARLLYEEMDTRIAAITNRAVRTLTIFSTLLIPPTFIAGAFGMNLRGIPWADNPRGFAIVILLCAIVVGASYGLLRRLKILN